MLLRFIGYIFSALALTAMLGVIAAAGVVWYHGQDLPEFESLAEYRPPETSEVLDDDGNVIARFAREQRAVVTIGDVPELVKNAFISAEDKNFYSHGGIDPEGIAKAMVRNVKAFASGGRMSGASTITQQVVKNMLLTNERSVRRKVREALLAMDVEKRLSKDRILELYLNQIYLGARSYGVAAASRNYFGKPLGALEPEEAAYLAALPKAPSALHPTRNTEAAVARRNYVLEEMVQNGHLDRETGEAAKAKPLVTRQTKEERVEDTYDWAAAYMIEEVRGLLLDAFKAQAETNGADHPESWADDKLYGGGLTIRTTFDREMQDYAAEALREGLHRYERRHGYVGPIETITVDGDWRKRLGAIPFPRDMGHWKVGVVLGLDGDRARIGLEEGGDDVEIKLENVKWARERNAEGFAGGPEPDEIEDVFSVGDVIYTAKLDPKDPDELEEGEVAEEEWGLRQRAQVNGAVIAMEPDTGRVLAMQGGVSAQQSEYNRATQAYRQPGSAFKPFIYAAALAHGYTPATIVIDAPVVFDQGEGQDLWIPTNYNEDQHFGPIPIRQGLELSINLITIRIAMDVGMESVSQLAETMGVYDEMPPYLSYSLGAGETTLARMAAAYGMFVNGGKRIEPTFVESIRDRDGEVFALDAGWIAENAPAEREQVIDEVTAFQTVSLMEGVVLRGTATRLTLLGFPVGGKTGTTNEARDAWFVGFTPDLVFGCYIGYDKPRSLGEKASGGALCGPVFDRFMRKAMADRIPAQFKPPESVDLIKIDRHTGRRVPSEVFGKDIIWEAFRPGTAPLEYDMGVTAYGAEFIPDPDAVPYQVPAGLTEPGVARPIFNEIPAPPVAGTQIPGVPAPGVPTAGVAGAAPNQAGLPPQPDPNAPALVFDPLTGRMVSQQPGITVAPAPGQPQQPGQPPQFTNSARDFQNGGGLY